MSENKAHFIKVLTETQPDTYPFKHWGLDKPFTESACQGVLDLPFHPFSVDKDYGGRRECWNEKRLFLNKEVCGEFNGAQTIVDTFLDEEVKKTLEEVCSINLKGGHLRVEYCQDVEGFYLEPHKDVGPKMITLQVYLTNEGEKNAGTDLYDNKKKLVKTIPYKHNYGSMFVPGTETWHGFEKKSFSGVRKSLIINYVTDEWRNRHELAI